MSTFDFDDPRLGDVTDGARMLHYVLTVASSARGRFPGGARALTRHLRLTDAAAVGAHLAELVEAGAVRLYEGLVDGTRVVVGELVIGRPKRSPSKTAELGADPLPAPAEERESHRSELSATLAPQGSPKVEPSVSPAVAETPEREKREIQNSLSPARAKPRTRRKPPREQLALGSPVESSADVVVPEPIRAAVETWEAHAAELRDRGMRVPEVARADLVALADGVAPDIFVDAVGHHLRSEPCYWGAPLALLAKRVEWAHSRVLCGDVPSRIVPLDGRARAWAESNNPALAAVGRQLLDACGRAALDPPPTPSASSTPRGLDLSSRRVDDALTITTVPDDEWAEDWSRALERLRETLDPYDVVHWLEPLDGRGVDLDGNPVLRAPDESSARWVEEHYGPLIEGALGYLPRFGVYEQLRVHPNRLDPGGADHAVM